MAAAKRSPRPWWRATRPPNASVSPSRTLAHQRPLFDFLDAHPDPRHGIRRTSPAVTPRRRGGSTLLNPGAAH